MPDNEFEESEDEEMNGINGVRYAKSVRYSRVSKSDEATGQAVRPPRARGIVDVLPAAATKLKSPLDNIQSSGSSGNGNRAQQNGGDSNGSNSSVMANATAVTAEKDGDVVMDFESNGSAAPDASTSNPATSGAAEHEAPASTAPESTAASDVAGRDTEMTEVP